MERQLVMIAHFLPGNKVIVMHDLPREQRVVKTILGQLHLIPTIRN